MTPTGDFPFTHDEIQAALRLVSGPDRADHDARAVFSLLHPDSDWAMSTEALMLISLATPAADAKARRLLAELRLAGRAEWLAEHAPGLPAEEGIRAWEAAMEEEVRGWAAEREALRRSLASPDDTGSPS